MTYIFKARTPEGKTVEQARLTVINGQTAWTGPEAEAIKGQLESTPHTLFGGVLDPQNERHLENLPYLFSGIRFWVEVE